MDVGTVLVELEIGAVDEEVGVECIISELAEGAVVELIGIDDDDDTVMGDVKLTLTRPIYNFLHNHNHNQTHYHNHITILLLRLLFLLPTIRISRRRIISSTS